MINAHAQSSHNIYLLNLIVALCIMYGATNEINLITWEVLETKWLKRKTAASNELSSNSSRAITFFFELILLEKAWTSSPLQLRVEEHVLL